MDTRYNGWTNRETWLVNLHFGDDTTAIEQICQDVRGDVDKLEDYIKSMVYDYVEEQTLNTFVSDMINLSAINWNELAASWMEGYEAAEEEDYDEE